MSKLQEAPIYDPMIEGADGKARLSWTLFFNALAAGDPGTVWLPVVTNLTFTGAAPTVTGIYYQNQGWTDFIITITPGTSTTSTAGSTFFDLPFAVAANAPAAVNNGISATYSGGVDSATKRCYSPGWTAQTTPLVVSGRVKS